MNVAGFPYERKINELNQCLVEKWGYVEDGVREIVN